MTTTTSFADVSSVAPWTWAHADAFKRMVDPPRAPSAFERATAEKLWSTYQRMPKGGDVKTFTALSAATGAGKTTSAVALMCHLALTSGASSAYVAPSIAVAEEVLKHLLRLTDGTDISVAAYSSIHRSRATEKDLRDYAEQGTRPSRQYTEDEFKAAQIVVTTHHRWRREADTDKDLGVLKREGRDRAAVFVDEEPSLELTLVRRPEDVSRLATLVAPKSTSDSMNRAAETLRRIHERMRAITDSADGAFLQESDIVTDNDILALAMLDGQEVSQCTSRLPYGVRQDALKDGLETLEFLRLAAQGRVFFDRRTGFHAYGSPVRPLPRHIILDGTADLNGLYAIGQHVSVVNALKADYSRVNLYAVKSPKDVRGRFNEKGILKNNETVRKYLSWFLPFLIDNTREGQHVLVYCKKDLLRYGVHCSPEFNDGAQKDAHLTTLRGRTIHWCHFGYGRGLNLWKHCTAYFRLGDFMLPTATAVARIGATTGETFSGEDLRWFNAAGIRDARIAAVQGAFAAVSNKQDAARIGIRNLDDEGVAAPGDLFMIDCELSILQAYRERMFPGSREYTYLGDYGIPEVVTGESHDIQRKSSGSGDILRSPTDGAAARVAELLRTTALDRLTYADTMERCRVRKNHMAQVMASVTVQEAMRSRGWAETTRKALGLPGKGKVLVRAGGVSKPTQPVAVPSVTPKATPQAVPQVPVEVPATRIAGDLWAQMFAACVIGPNPYTAAGKAYRASPHGRQVEEIRQRMACVSADTTDDVEPPEWDTSVSVVATPGAHPADF